MRIPGLPGRWQSHKQQKINLSEIQNPDNCNVTTWGGNERRRWIPGTHQQNEEAHLNTPSVREETTTYRDSARSGDSSNLQGKRHQQHRSRSLKLQHLVSDSGSTSAGDTGLGGQMPFQGEPTEPRTQSICGLASSQVSQDWERHNHRRHAGQGAMVKVSKRHSECCRLNDSSPNLTTTGQDQPELLWDE